MIPPKVILSGDKSKAEKLRAFGLSQLRILHESMAFRGLQQDVKRVRFEDGASIVVKSTFGLDEVSIFVPPVMVEEVEVEEVEEELEARVEVLGSRITLRAGPASVLVCEFTEEELLEYKLTWAENNPEEIAVDSKEWIYVLGGVEPYQWKVWGGGYWFDEEHTLTKITSTENLLATTGTRGSKVELFSDDTICGPAEIKVQDLCEQEADGTVPFFKEGIPVLVWSEDNPEEIGRDSQVDITVEGGTEPYQWVVSGQGYWFDEECTITEIVVGENLLAISGVAGCRVKLYTDNTVCGDPDIQVTDRCGQSVSGIVPYEDVLEWFKENPADMSRGSKLLLYIVGGTAPYKWVVEGKGFWFDEEETLQEITTSSKWVHLFAEASSIVPINIWPFKAGACPPASITVEDDCESKVDSEIGITGVEELAWEGGADVGMEACTDGEVTLKWEGGAPPFYGELDNEHFSFDLTILPLYTLRLYREAVISADDDSCGEKTTVTITDTCGATINTSVEIKRADTHVEWDNDNSDDEIDPGETGVPIAVTGGAGPYKWAVSPSDEFSLGPGQEAEIETEGPTATLNAEADACGTCTITVVDCCGEGTTGAVRSTAGQWIACGGSSVGGCTVDYTIYVYIGAQYRWGIRCGHGIWGLPCKEHSCTNPPFTSTVCPSECSDKMCFATLYQWKC